MNVGHISGGTNAGWRRVKHDPTCAECGKPAKVRINGLCRECRAELEG